jgi:mono/diheme cytochrome c family protein
MQWRRLRTALGGVGILGVLLQFASADEKMSLSHETRPARPPIRITGMQLHMSPGGVPPGWTFTIPGGDSQAGRKAFVKFECFTCHNVQGEPFPAIPKDTTHEGPELTGMGGGMHPPEYFAQSIMDPNAVLLDEPGYTGPDGKSRMPDYADSMSVRELLDLVAYLESLKGGEAPGAPAQGHHTMPPGDMMLPGSHGPGSGGGNR